MEYEKKKITITLEDEEVDLFWNILMFSLDYNDYALKHKSKATPMSAKEKKLADQLEELTRPSYV